MRVRAIFGLLSLVAFSNHAVAADAAPKTEPEEPERAPRTHAGSAGVPEVPSTSRRSRESARTPPPPETSDRALAGAAAVVPGAVVHGMGHYAAGETTTGNRLLLAEGIGLGLVFGAGYAIVSTGASRYVVGPAAATVIFGVGLFGTSFLADAYGSVSPDAAAAGRRTRAPAWVETELGYRHVSDPIFSYEDFVVESVSIRSGRLRLTPSGWFSLGADNARYRIEGAYRFLGRTPTVADQPVMNDHLDAVLGMVHHRYATERFTRSSMELAVDTRYDLGHVGQTLRGAFVEASAGYSFARIDYDVQGIEVPADFDDLLLARFGFGAVFRGKSNPGSEARVYYDHRHDDFASGLVMSGLGSGVAGHFGMEARWFFTPELGLGAQAEVGSAYVTGLSILFRQAGAGLGGDERRTN